MNKKIIGIIGGMGPLATADLFQKIILHTQASCDQEHLHVCIDSNTNIPDRTEALLHGGADPVPEMTRSARHLASIGAQVLIMPCNTAHGFYEQVQSAVDVPVLHMIALTRDALTARGVRRAGLLATDGTIETGIYQRTFAGSGIELLTPPAADQAAVMDVIYNGVKAGDVSHDTAAFRRTLGKFLVVHVAVNFHGVIVALAEEFAFRDGLPRLGVHKLEHDGFELNCGVANFLVALSDFGVGHRLNLRRGSLIEPVGCRLQLRLEG